jgi:hypothetical protein
MLFMVPPQWLQSAYRYRSGALVRVRAEYGKGVVEARRYLHPGQGLARGASRLGTRGAVDALDPEFELHGIVRGRGRGNVELGLPVLAALDEHPRLGEIPGPGIVVQAFPFVGQGIRLGIIDPEVGVGVGITIRECFQFQAMPGRRTGCEIDSPGFQVFLVGIGSDFRGDDVIAAMPSGHHGGEIDVLLIRPPELAGSGAVAQFLTRIGGGRMQARKGGQDANPRRGDPVSLQSICHGIPLGWFNSVLQGGPWLIATGIAPKKLGLCVWGKFTIFNGDIEMLESKFSSYGGWDRRGV